MAESSVGFFVATVPGLEPLLLAELAELGVRGKTQQGGVEARGTLRALWTVCLASRVAESVRVRLKPFSARTFEELCAGLERLPFHAYLPAGAAVTLSVTCHESRLWHSGAVEERLLGVLSARRGVRAASEGEAAQRLFVRLERDVVQVSVDAGGERLHRRGYRTHVVEASLRETLASAVLRAAGPGVDEAPALWDPFCGAGTIGLEWLERRGQRLAGARRDFAFERWPIDAPAALATLRDDLTGAPLPLGEVRFIGSDRSARAVAAARENAATAELGPWCELHEGDFADVAARVPRGALIVSNPPYGVRIQERDVMARLSQLLARRKDLRPVTLIVGGPARKQALSLGFASLLTTKNGGLSVDVLQRR